MTTPLDTFPLLARAGSIIPAAEGVRYAAEAPVPARELLVFTGADGETELYDDAGDGYGEGLRISLRYREESGELILGTAAGKMPGAVSVTVRFFRPDGSFCVQTARYDGTETRVNAGEKTGG